jgi:hypothetical protein
MFSAAFHNFSTLVTELNYLLVWLITMQFLSHWLRLSTVTYMYLSLLCVLQMFSNVTMFLVVKVL